MEPEQTAPPFDGLGFVQLLDLDLTPPPQVTLHDVHEDQDVQPPSKVNIQYLII